MTKITNSNISFTSKITVLTGGSVHKVSGKNVTLSVFPSDSIKCDSFISICSDTAEGIMVDPWHPDKKAQSLQSFIPARYLNFYVETKEQTKEIIDTFTHAKNIGNRNFKIEENAEKDGLFTISVDHLKDEA